MSDGEQVKYYEAAYKLAVKLAGEAQWHGYSAAHSVLFDCALYLYRQRDAAVKRIIASPPEPQPARKRSGLMAWLFGGTR